MLLALVLGSTHDHLTPTTILDGYKPTTPTLNIKFTTAVKRWIKHGMSQKVAYYPPKTAQIHL